ncbi:hypothetical protein PO909_023960 [Leuciscus waleckii]
MVLKYSSVDLQRLSSFCRLSGGIYNRCAALGITRRQRYIHRGSRRNPLVRTSTVSQDNYPIPVIWSPHRRSSIRSNATEEDNAGISETLRQVYLQEWRIAAAKDNSVRGGVKRSTQQREYVQELYFTY